MTAIYLDYNATTPVDPRVVEAMLPWFTERFWNAASSHGAGETARRAVERARADVAALINAASREIVITSGSTEANNLALKGVVQRAKGGRDTVVVAATEHKAVLDAAQWLVSEGYRVEVISVDRDGLVDLDALVGLMSEQVALVSVMLANNETGVMQPLAEIAEIAHRSGALIHTDAAQAVGKVPVDVVALGVDLLSLSAHKFYGPKGVGALYVRRGVGLGAQLHGGGHEAGLRSGTLNVPGVIGMGAAAELAMTALDDDALHCASLVERLVTGLVSRIDDVEYIGTGAVRLPNTASLRFVGADADAVMANAPAVLVSSGSACSSRVPEPSHVLLAMDMTQDEAYECLRFSVGRNTTTEEIDLAVVAIADAVSRVRRLNSADDLSRTPEGAIR